MESDRLQRAVDRLVDGELDATEYCEVLIELESTPGGWRQCALAFLEAQAIQRQLSQGAGTVHGEHLRRSVFPPTGMHGPAETRPRPWHEHLLWIGAAWAASLVLVAQWAGRAVPAGIVRQVPSPAESRSFPAREPTVTDGKRSPTMDLTEPPSRRPTEHTLVLDGRWRAPDGSLSVPVVNTHWSQAQELLRASSQEVDTWEAQLRQQGQSIKRTRRFSTMQLPDGRAAIFPMEDIEVLPAAWNSGP